MRAVFVVYCLLVLHKYSHGSLAPLPTRSANKLSCLSRPLVFMQFSKLSLEKFNRIHDAVGPLRYQTAQADCVPTTVVNALLFVTGKNLPARLMRLIWACSLDLPGGGTGWVCSKLLGEVLEAWFTMSEFDGARDTLADYQSTVLQGTKVTLKRRNSLVSTLDAGGVVCITTENGGHYALVHSHDEGKSFYGFDPTWCGPRKRKAALAMSEATNGMVNSVWTRDQLQTEFENEASQFVHLIYPRSVSNQ